MKHWHKSRSFFEAITFAVAGVREAYARDANVRRQMAIAAWVIFLGVLFRISALEFAVLFLTTGLVLGLEMINAALEQIEDIVWPEYREAVKRSKDIAAGAVLVASVAALIVGLLIFLPPLAKLALLVY